MLSVKVFINNIEALLVRQEANLLILGQLHYLVHAALLIFVYRVLYGLDLCVVTFRAPQGDICIFAYFKAFVLG